MSKRESIEYRAKVTNDAGLVRGKVPSPLIRELGGRPGDYMVFHYDGAGTAEISVARSKGIGKSLLKSQTGRAGRNGKKR